DHVCRELDAGREVTLYEEIELLPELHCGSDVGDERVTVLRDGGDWNHIYTTVEGEERKVAVVRTVEELEIIFEKILDHPWRFLHG
ncbi:MAG: hypothetical protein ABIP55_05755, partial [Tepidisphaeraceae bacterium]